MCRLKDTRHVATRDDRLASNLSAAVGITMTASDWLQSRT